MMDGNPEMQSDMPMVLFVCTGNTCRSPMAEFCFDRMLSGKIRSVSAGLYAFDGEAMSENSLEALASIGIDGKAFRSQSVSFDLVENSSLILTMTASHRGELLRRYPEALSKCHTLLPDGDISDPFGQSAAVYQAALTEIRRGLENWIKFFDVKSESDKKFS